MNHADWNVTNVTDNQVHIVDIDIGNKSVTNDAENVCEKLYKQYGNLRFTYLDTIGNVDELIHKKGKFIKFKPCKFDKNGKLI